MGRASQLLKSGFSKSQKQKVRVNAVRVMRGTGDSGRDVLEDEQNRIEDYIKNFYLDNIIDMASSRDAVDSLKYDSTKAPIGNDDFENLLSGGGLTGRESFAEYLFEKYGVERLEKLVEEDINLKSGKDRKGFRINKDIYLIKIKTKTGKEYSQARSFKTGRVVKLDRNLKRIFSRKKTPATKPKTN